MPDCYQVRLPEEGLTLWVEEGENLYSVLTRGKVELNGYCSGTGTCGKCRIKMLAGPQVPVTPEEKTHLREEELADGIRLACCIEVTGDLEILLASRVIGKHGYRILEKGKIPQIKPDCSWSGGENKFRPLGIAIDIGTTTLVVALVDLTSGSLLTTASALNPQKRFGLDVLSRIQYCRRHPQGLEELQSCLIRSLNELINQVCQQVHALPGQVCSAAVAGNTTMMHLFLGVDPFSLGRAPYRPVWREALSLKAEETGLEINEQALVYCLPAVSAFIGADIVAGLLATRLYESKGNQLLVDIGTNGEIVLNNQGHLLACSCAAGPALEGVNIGCGMIAATGAVEMLYLNEQEELNYQTIGMVSPQGICGSGLVDLVAEFLKTGLIGQEGRFQQDVVAGWEKRGHFRQMSGGWQFLLNPEAKEKAIVIEQRDLRKLQLAIGAIKAGMAALLQEAQISPEELDRLVIAGGFGQYLRVESLVRVGLVPGQLAEKVEFAGNSSIAGTVMALLSHQERQKAENLAREVRYIELSLRPDFERLFVQCLRFERGDLICTSKK